MSDVEPTILKLLGLLLEEDNTSLEQYFDIEIRGIRYSGSINIKKSKIEMINK